MSDEKPENGAGENMIPISRLNAKIEQVKALEAERETLRQQLAAQQSEAVRTAARAREDIALVRSGIIDAEDQELVRWRYSRMPESQRGDFTSWVTEKAATDRHLANLFVKAPNGRQDASAAPSIPGPGVVPQDAPQPHVARPPITPTNGGVVQAPTPGQTRTLRWWQGLTDAEKKATGITKEEILRGLQGAWPRG